MEYDLRTAALMGCCVLAVVLAAAFFPAAGYGDLPDREAVDSAYYDEPVPAEVDVVESLDGTLIDFEGSDFDPDDDGTDESDDERETDEDDAGTGAEESSESGLASLLSVLGILLLGGVVTCGGVVVWRLTSPAADRTMPETELPDGVLGVLSFRLRRIPQATMIATIAVARVVPALADVAVESTASGLRALSNVSGDLGREFGRAAIALPAVLGTGLNALGSAFTLPSLPASILDTRPTLRRGTTADETGRKSDETPKIAEPDSEPKSVEEAWEALVERLALDRPSVRTPAECARIAIAAGFPAEPVSRLTDVFREIRYGNRPPSPDRTKLAREAARRLDDGEDARTDGGDRE